MHINLIANCINSSRKKKTFHFTQSSFTLLLQHPTLENVPPVHKHHRIWPRSPVLSPWCRTLFLLYDLRILAPVKRLKVVGGYDV